MTQQCLGTTRNGEQCKITGNLTDGYCHLHRKQRPSQKAEEQPKEKSIPSPQPERSSSYATPPQYPQLEPLSIKTVLMIAVALFLIILMLINLGKNCNGK
jgi:hypothetical protein